MNKRRATYHRGRTGNRDPTQGLPDLEGESQTIDDGNNPQMDGVREWNGGG